MRKDPLSRNSESYRKEQAALRRGMIIFWLLVIVMTAAAIWIATK